MNIRDWYKQRRRRQAIALIRKEMDAMGHDLTDLSDEELEAKWAELWEQFRQGMIRVSVSALQAASALQSLADTFGKFDSQIIAATWPDVVYEDILDADVVIDNG